MTKEQLQHLIDTDADVRSFVRARAGQRGTSFPIRVVSGVAGPSIKGEGYYWTTPSGKTRVNHPNAYKWPTVYHCSTIHLEVSVGWLKRIRPSFAREDEVAA